MEITLKLSVIALFSYKHWITFFQNKSIFQLVAQPLSAINCFSYVQQCTVVHNCCAFTLHISLLRGIVFFSILIFAFLTHIKNPSLKQHIREAHYVTAIKCTGASACIELQLIIFHFSLIDTTLFLHYSVVISSVLGCYLNISLLSQY